MSLPCMAVLELREADRSGEGGRTGVPQLRETSWVLVSLLVAAMVSFASLYYCLKRVVELTGIKWLS